MKSLKVGTHRQRVTLMDIPESARDSYGQPPLEGIEVGTYWAEIRPLSGSEQVNVRAMWPVATHIVTLRWLGSNVAISPRMKLVITKDPGNRTLNILNANNTEERNRSWVLTCQEKSEAIS